MRAARFLTLTALAALALPAAAAAGDRPRQPELEGRAIQPHEPQPPGTITDCPTTAPSDPASPLLQIPEPQPAGGYSALVDARRGTFWAMPDNGYGAKGNSCQFILRVDRVDVDWLRTGRASEPGSVEVLESVRLRDPERKIPFPIFREATSDRLLTGWDFDPESMRIAPDGTWWFGDEFGPYLLHTDRTGRLLEAPISTPGVRAPENLLSPPSQPVNLGGSSGFESMALTDNGRHLLPALERALTTEPDKTKRLIFRYDLRRERWSGRIWIYRADPAITTDPPGQDQHVLGDMTAVGRSRYVVIERDFRQGAAALSEKVFEINLRRADANGVVPKREVLDLLEIRDPRGISLVGARPGDFGLGDPFRFPYVTTESVLPTTDDELTIVNDNNFGSVGGRNPELPDYTDFIEVEVPALDRERGHDDR